MGQIRVASWRVWATVLDAAIILFGSAGIVIALGGGTRFVLGSVRITTASALRPFAVMGALLVLRLLIDRRNPPLPAIPRGVLDTSPARFKAAAPVDRQVLCCALAVVLGSIVWIWPHLTHLRRIPDAGDPVFSAWRIARIAHQLANDPRHLFAGNIFYPLPLTMTYSDATLLQSVIGAPFILAGMDPLVVANGVFLLAFPGCALAFFYASWRLTGDPRAAVIAGLIGTWYPFHFEHYSHMELQFFMFVPLAMLAALKLIAAPTPAAGVLLGVTVALQWLASLYLGLMLCTMLIPFGALLLCGWRPQISRRLTTAAVLALAVSLSVIAMISLPYLQTRATRGDRNLREVQEGSAVPSDYGYPNPKLSNYAWLSREGSKPERQLFPGGSTLALAAAGIVPPLTVPTAAILVSAALVFDWSLGLNGLTYDELYRHVPPYRGVRVPARFGAVLGCVLALLAGYGAHRIIHLVGNARSRQNVAFALLVALVLWDLRPSLHLQDYYSSPPAIYSAVNAKDVLAEFPADHDIDFMYFSTVHWARLLGGYSGFTSYSGALLDARTTLPSAKSLATLKRLGATHLTYNCAFEPNADVCSRVTETLDRSSALEPVASSRWYGAEVRLYRFR